MNNRQMVALKQDKEQKSILQIRIIIKIPKKYHREIMFYKLRARYKLKVNLLGILPGQHRDKHSWVSVQVSGKLENLVESLIYFDDLNIDVLH